MNYQDNFKETILKLANQCMTYVIEGGKVLVKYNFEFDTPYSYIVDPENERDIIYELLH